MNQSNNIFYQIVNKVHRNDLLDHIIAKQFGKYDLQPYKIEKTYGETIKKIYQIIQSKYEITKELQYDSNNWNENERRVFVWFIIVYCHFAEIENRPLTSEDWNHLSQVFFHKSPSFLEFQYLNLLKPKKRVSWTDQEDKLLTNSIGVEKAGKWNEISKRMFFLSQRKVFRSPKHCRQRWLNHLDKSKRHGEWTLSEDYQIFSYVNQEGKRWSKLVALLNETRTQHMIKNRYNSLISKNKTSKKQKEDEIFRKILRELQQKLEINDPKPEQTYKIKVHRQSTIQSPLSQQNNQNQIPQNKKQRTNSFLELNGAPNFFIPAFTCSQNVGYSYYLNCNQLIVFCPQSQLFFPGSSSSIESKQSQESSSSSRIWSQKSNFSFCGSTTKIDESKEMQDSLVI